MRKIIERVNECEPKLIFDKYNEDEKVASASNFDKETVRSEIISEVSLET